jgi:hypothetical protein
MMLAMTGLGGLPFAEDLMDMVDFVGTKMKSQLGYKDPKVDIRLDARAFAKELGANPDLVMHGLSRETFGLHWLGNMVGLPVPKFDVSGSLSLGRVIPGVEPILGREGRFADRFLESAEDIGGAALSIPLSVMRALADDNPDVFKRWERALPSALRSVSRGARYALEGEETTRSGATLTTFDASDPEQLLEIVAQTLGAAPSRVNEERELRWAQKEHIRYYQTRRTLLLAQLSHAYDGRDKETIITMKKAIRTYNLSVPHKALRLTQKDIRRSLKARRRNRRLDEQNITKSKRYRPLARQVESQFE